jgi:hypothetical protein
MPAITPGQLFAAFSLQTLIFIFFCLALYKALLVIKGSNRTIPPGAVWLLLIPGFSLFWNFKVVAAISSSLYKEFTERNFEIEDRPGYTNGMIYAISSVLYPLVIMAVPSMFIPAAIINLIGLIFFVRYWMKINWYRKVLEEDVHDSSDNNSSI